MMNAKQALAQAVKRWGKKAGVEDTKVESSEAQRQQAKAELEQLKAYLSKEQQREPENRKRIQQLASTSWRMRYSVGVVDSIAGAFSAFMVYGQGDTWEEAFAKADERYPAKKAA